MVRITIPGEPIGQGRGRATVFTPAGGKPRARVYDPKKSREWKRAAAFVLRAAWRGRQPIAGPVRLNITAVFSCPKSDFRKRTLRGRRWHTNVPDRDNIEKIIMDSAKGLLWKDDRQVCAGWTLKVIGAQGEAPRVELEVEAIEETVDEHAEPEAMPSPGPLFD